MATSINTLNYAIMRDIKQRLRQTLKPLAEELGVAIDLDRFTFTACDCKAQLHLAVLDYDGGWIKEEVQAFRRYAESFGLKSTDLWREFVYHGQSYTIWGIDPENPKHPIIATSTSDAAFEFDCRTVLESMGREVPRRLQHSSRREPRRLVRSV